jgi:hypothetical protein
MQNACAHTAPRALASWLNSRVHLNRHDELGLSIPIVVVRFLCASGTSAGASLIGTEIRVVRDADSSELWD